MSRSGFFHKFTRIYGESPTTYLRRYKAGQIFSDLINTDITRQSLATMHGSPLMRFSLNSPKKMLGDPPREYAKSQKSKITEF